MDIFTTVMGGDEEPRTPPDKIIREGFDGYTYVTKIWNTPSGFPYSVSEIVYEKSDLQEAKEALQKAIEKEAYKDAAFYRDMIEDLKKVKKCQDNT